jgi:hypothetical protein
MTTTSELLAPEDVEAFCTTLREWPNSEMAYEQFALGVRPFTTIYFEYEPSKFMAASMTLIEVHKEFDALLGHPFKVRTHPISERLHPYHSKRLPELNESAKLAKIEKSFNFKVSDEPNHLSSGVYAARYWRSSTWDGKTNNSLSSAQLYYRWQWWLDHQDQWRSFVLKTADRLQADQIYSGFAMGNPLDIGARYEVAVWERALAPHFYGLDIDFPFSMDRPLQEGIRPPTLGVPAIQSLAREAGPYARTGAREPS